MESETLRRAARQQLESLLTAGVRQLPKPAAPARFAPPPEAEVDAPVRHATPNAMQPTLLPDINQPDGGSTVSSATTLEVLQHEVADCTLCPELASTRTQTVFGVGDPDARLCFLGEAPGADEDRRGEPFVGRAGQLLDKIIGACKMRRDEVYILNVLKCRPPGNRNPAPTEATSCRRFLDRQLELVNPEFICCLGAVAAQNLLGTQTAIGKLRGRIHQHGGIRVVCTYHPAYLLRNPSAKKDAWDDMKFLMREMGVEL